MSEVSKIKGPLILYDGNCILCNRAIQFILKHERNSALKFIDLDNSISKSIVGANFNSPYPDSIFLYLDGDLLQESQAAFRILEYLKSPYSLVKVFSFLPTSFTDRLYRWVARNRYRWYGKVEENCLVLSEEQKLRFIS